MKWEKNEAHGAFFRQIPAMYACMSEELSSPSFLLMRSLRRLHELGVMFISDAISRVGMFICT